MDVLGLLLKPERLARLVETNAIGAAGETYRPIDMLTDLREGVWSELEKGTSIGPYRRNLQRGYLKQIENLMTAEVNYSDLPWYLEDRVIQTPVNVSQSDIRALARGELHALRDEVEKSLSGSAPDEMTERHFQDVLMRIDRILEGK